MDNALLAYHVDILRWITLASVTVALWEHVTMMHLEMAVWIDLFRKIGLIKAKKTTDATRVMQNTRLRASFGPMIVIALRWGLVTAAALATTLFFGRPASCSGIMRGMWFVFCFNWAAATSIFCIRVSYMYDRDRRVTVPLIALWLCALGVWLAISSTYSAVNSPAAGLYAPYCVPVPDPKWRAIGFGMAMVFDAIVLGLTLFRLHQLKRPSNGAGARMHSFILRSNLFWFFTVFSVNSTCFIVELSVNDPVLSHIPSPIAFVVNAIVAVRIVFTTNLLEKPSITPTIGGVLVSRDQVVTVSGPDGSITNGQRSMPRYNAAPQHLSTFSQVAIPLPAGKEEKYDLEGGASDFTPSPHNTPVPYQAPFFIISSDPRQHLPSSHPYISRPQ